MITEEKKANKKRLFKRLIALIVIIGVVILAQFAWAKYIAKVDGQATAKIAEMKFKINERYYKSTEQINFSLYRDDSNQKIAEDMLAPGTYGYIPITIDATETQTSLEYEISIDLTNRPTNLKFYSDENKTKEILVKNDKIIRRGYISINEENSPRAKNETIYWQWLEETGENKYEINENDRNDSEYMDKIMTMQIGVKGTQMKEMPIYIGNNVSIGDTVSYKAHGQSEFIYCRVINITNNQVEIMPIDADGYAEYAGNARLGYQNDNASNIQKKLEAIESYCKAIKIIDNAAIEGFYEKYGFYGATRALTIEDVNRLTGYRPNDTQAKTFNSKNYINQTFIVDNRTTVNAENILATSLVKNNGEKIKSGDTITIGETIGEVVIESVTLNSISGDVTSIGVRYMQGNTEKQDEVTKYFKKEKHSCWLNSRVWSNVGGYCRFSVQIFDANGGQVTSSDDVFNSNNGAPRKANCFVVPVSSIPSTTHAKQITDENNPDTISWEVTE